MNPSIRPGTRFLPSSLSAFAAACLAAMSGCGFILPANKARAGRTAWLFSRAKQMGTATLIYSSDYDERLPLSSSWMDGIARYLGNPEAYTSPYFPSENYSFAMNASVSGVPTTRYSDAQWRVVFFTSSLHKRNASGERSVLWKPPKGTLLESPSRGAVAQMDSSVKGYESVPLPSSFKW